jgi:uncharacterized protein with FMN-binding domain
MTSRPGHRSGKKVANSLVALSSAAVLTVYAAGYARTRAAAERFAADDVRRPVVPAPAGDIAFSSARPPAPVPEARALGPIDPVSRSAPRRSEHSDAAKRLESQARHAPAQASTPTAPVSATMPASVAEPAAAAVPSANAAAPVGDTKLADVPPTPPAYKDGTYYGWGTSRHGDIQAYVVIEGGHIVTTAISQCLTRYSCSWIAHLPGHVIRRQSADVDYVTGATPSNRAF